MLSGDLTVSYNPLVASTTQREPVPLKIRRVLSRPRRAFPSIRALPRDAVNRQARHLSGGGVISNARVLQASLPAALCSRRQSRSARCRIAASHHDDGLCKLPLTIAGYWRGGTLYNTNTPLRSNSPVFGRATPRQSHFVVGCVLVKPVMVSRITTREKQQYAALLQASAAEA